MFRLLSFSAARLGLFIALMCVGLAGSSTILLAQKADASSTTQALQQIETQVIHIGRLQVSPGFITRKPGKFFLVLVNDTRDPNLAVTLLSLSPAQIVTDVTSLADLLELQRKRKTVILMDGTAGVIQLKVAALGAVVSTITIQ